MFFYELNDYTIGDVNSLIANEVEEDIHLDYKASGALDKADNKRTEITKDVSAFANSDGGIIIYGIKEKDHRPQEVTPVDGRVYTKEWLENIIQLIQPRIDGVIIYPIRVNDLEESIYIVKIPRSISAPHMARDKRYYKRFNFKSEPMEDYEVKDLYNRVSAPKLKIDSCYFGLYREREDTVEYQLFATIANDGNRACESYKLNFYINIFHYCDFGSEPKYSSFTYTVINRNRLKLGISAQEVIYPYEVLDVGHIIISVPKKYFSEFRSKLVIDMILFFAGGTDDVAYIPASNQYIEGRDNINRLLDSRQD